MMPDERGFGLRGRLTAFFIVIVVLPILLVAIPQQRRIEQQVAQRSDVELANVQRATVALLDARRARAGDLARDLADELAVLLEADPGALDAEGAPAVADLLAARGAVALPARADQVAVVASTGDVLAVHGRDPSFATDGAQPETARIGAAANGGATLPGGLLVTHELADGDGATVARVAAIVWADQVSLDSLGLTGAGAILSGDRVLAVSGAEDGTVPDVLVSGAGGGAGAGAGAGDGADANGTRVPVARAPTDGGDEVRFAAAGFGAEGGGDPDLELLVWSVVGPERSSLASTALVVLPAVLLAGAIGFVLASTVVTPVRRAADVARAVAAGDLSQTLEPSGGRELADLSGALNTMSAELAARLAQLEDRERQLRGSLARLGQSLSSSLDLHSILAVVVETAMESLHADRAVLSLLTPERDALYTKIARGLDGAAPLIRIGEGVVGSSAASGRSYLLPGAGDTPAPVAGEPVGVSSLVVPLLARGRVLGVLSLLRDAEDAPFAAADLETLRSFSAQASVAIENVLLHEEARRLSVTDPLTGLWNFRYFQLQAEREVEAADRSERPLSLLVVDIDHFKVVNDTYGHQVGDEVLIEIARRLRDSTRVPDVVARYGGEEFIVLLPGTDSEGAEASAERIRAAVAAAPVEPVLPGVTADAGGSSTGPLRITCSVGVATRAAPGEGMAALLRSADSAMYEAKRQGRDRVMVASP